MNERASRPLSQLGWAVLGAIPAGCVAALASTYLFFDSTFATAVGIAYLVLVIPVSLCIAVVLVAGARLATRQSQRTGAAKVTSALLALAFGILAIIISNLLLNWFRTPYWPWACFGALIGGTGSVFLARLLPHRSVTRATGWESTFGEQ